MVLCVAPYVAQRFYSLWFRLAMDFICGKPTRLRSATEKAWAPMLPFSHGTSGCTAGQALWIVFQWMDILLHFSPERYGKYGRCLMSEESHEYFAHLQVWIWISILQELFGYLVLINHKSWDQQEIVDHCSGKKPLVPLKTGF